MTRPQIDSAKAAAYLDFASRRYGIAIPSLCVLGVRGYYLDTVGKPGVNERGVYDDAIVVRSPSVLAAFNGNTDPSAWRKGIATLRPGAYPYKPGKHGISRAGGGYPAFRPATKGEALPVDRDGIAQPEPGVAINIHRGGFSGTSSLGCQTIHPSQWDAFHALLTAELKRSGQREFLYILVDEVAFRKEAR
jgi:lysozyme